MAKRGRRASSGKVRVIDMSADQWRDILVIHRLNEKYSFAIVVENKHFVGVDSMISFECDILLRSR